MNETERSEIFEQLNRLTGELCMLRDKLELEPHGGLMIHLKLSLEMIDKLRAFARRGAPGVRPVRE